MNSEPSTSHDTTVSTNENHLKHMLSHDALAFGEPSEMSDLNLPTKQDILRYYYFLSEQAKMKNKRSSYKAFTPLVLDKLIEIWSKINIKILTKHRIVTKLNNLLDKYHAEVKNRTKGFTFTKFVLSTKELFYIGKCRCNLKSALCTCDLIPSYLKEFMMDQNNERKSTILQYATEIEEQVAASTITQSAADQTDKTYQPDYINNNEYNANVAGEQNVMVRGPYTPRYDATNFAMMCDRFGVPDRVASALATSLMEDLGIKDYRGHAVIMDKAKVRREKVKCRADVLRKQFDGSNLIAFSFDGRKNDSLTREKIGMKYYSKTEKEPHIVVLREPNSRLIGYAKLENEDAEQKFTKLNQVFIENKLSLDSLIGICCDGEPTNTGIHNGILRRFELHLKRPLHWFVCLLHFNELPFRHLFDFLEKSATTGPRTTTGKLSRQIAGPIENYEVVEFGNIILENMPPNLNSSELSTDAKYLYQMANAVSNGEVPADLCHTKPGLITHARWLTKANRLLRLYVATKNPSNNLKTLAIYIMRVYVPMYFNFKYYSSVVNGSVLFYKFIRSTQYLEPNLRRVINEVIKDNAYFAHSENILLSMLFDEKKETRDKALKKIIHYRNHLDDPMQIRVYRKPIINFNCSDYTDMVDLNDDTVLSEPPITRSIPYDHLKRYLEDEKPPLSDIHIPLHIQGTERHVQLLASVSKRAAEEVRGGVMSVTLESRAKIPRLESKKDLTK